MRRAHLSAAALVVAASLALAGCSGDDKPATDDSPEAQKVAGGEVVDATWPLTGLAVAGDASAEQTRPVLVTKMDNTSSSAPQVGLGEADLVVEELVEGGLTRLAAFYYSELPKLVGPVRSMRASDIGIVSPVKGQVVTSGAAAVTINRIKHAGIKFYPYGTKGFYRASDRSAPYNVMAQMSVIAKEAERSASRPDDYLPWGDEKDFPGGQPARTIAAHFGGGHTTDWRYDGKGYVNQNTYAQKGDEFPADTVLVLRVKVGDAGYLDPAGNHVPETKLTGKGQAMIFHDGRLVRGTWAKSGLAAPLKLSTKAGGLTVPAGHTWIELVPAAAGDVTFTKK